jgi:hypothetical protein
MLELKKIMITEGTSEMNRNVLSKNPPSEN